MGHFYTPHIPAQQGPVNSTLPLPHDPIPAQGSQPPRCQVAASLMMIAVLASWPSDLEPRLTRPNDQRQKIAPLTLVYGNQPRPQPFLTTVELGQLIAAWPPDAPLPPRGQQRAWMPTVITSVPSRPLGQINQVVGSWPLDLEPVLQRPNSVQQKIAPLTLTYGQQPRPQPFLTTVELHQLVRAWPLDYPPVQGPVESAATLPPPPVVTFVPFARPRWDILALNDRPYTVALVTSFVVAPESSDQPPRVRPLSFAAIAITQQAWQPEVLIPPGPKTAAWNVPPLVAAYLPKPRVPDAIVAAHHLADPLPLRRVPSVVPTFPAVSQPVPQPPLSVPELTAIVASWAQTWGAQTAPKSAAWNVPPILISLPHVQFPALIWTTWVPPFLAPPRPVQIAPLTRVYGQAPPRFTIVSRMAIIGRAWPPDLEPRLGRPNGDRVHIAPLTLPPFVSTAVQERDDKLRSMSRVRGRQLIVDYVNRGAAVLGDAAFSQGPWTPVDASGAGLVLTVNSARYLRKGSELTLHADFVYQVTADPLNVQIGGIPFALHAAQNQAVTIGLHQVGTPVMAFAGAGGMSIFLFDGVTSANLTNAQLSGTQIILSAVLQLPV